jgi:hypothetical protein
VPGELVELDERALVEQGSMRSRAVSLPLACCFSTARAEPACTASSRRSRSSASLPAVVWMSVREAVARAAQLEIGLKWPNDLVVADGELADRKLGGILCETVPAEQAVVVGIGLNVTLRERELPVPQASSLALAGAELHGPRHAAARAAAFLRLLVRALVRGRRGRAGRRPARGLHRGPAPRSAAKCALSCLETGS